MMKRGKVSLATRLAVCCVGIFIGGCSDEDGDGGSKYAGTYRITVSGDDRGTFTGVVDDAGNLTGSGRTDAIGNTSAIGRVDENGRVQFGVSSSGATFTGTISGSGDVSGIWENGVYGGTFSGTKQ